MKRCVLLGLLLLLSACHTRRTEPPPPDAVVVILPREPEQLDPRFVSDAYAVKITRLLFASLMRIDPFTLEAVPDLAASVQVEDDTRYRVVLRPNLHFSDGTVLDADDVVATFRGLVDPAVKSRYASTFARIAKVEAVSPREVLFELGAPHATFLTDLEVPIMRAEDARKPPAPGTVPVGAGPYRLGSRAAGLYALRANPRYHGPPPPHAGLSLLVIRDDNTRALRLLAGAADLALNTVPPLLLPLFTAPRFQIRSEPGIGTTYLGLNLAHPALADVRVRRALAHALDRARVVRHKLLGRAQLASSWIPPGHWAHAADTPVHAYDPDAARALLDAAGLAPKDGVRLALTLRTSSDRAVLSLARALASMLAEVGIDLDVRPSENATLLADLARGRFEVAFLQSPDVIEPHTLSWFFTSDRIPETGKREGGNRWRVRVPELDAAFEDGRRALDRNARVAAYHRVQHLLARELPVIPLWHEDVVAVTSRRLEAFRVPRDGRFGTLAAAY
ncbi:MAG: ABC transporter substrate-binding protein [Polyangiales bacterium]